MKATNTLLFIIIVLLCLGTVSALFPEEGIAFGKRKLYFPAIEDVLANESGNSAMQRVKEIEESLRLQQYEDSIYADSLAFYTRFFRESPSRIYLPGDDWSYFNELFQQFDTYNKEKEIIHILHYGDSQIESDRITSYIRQRLQEKFGGQGPGLLPAVQPIPSVSVGQSASENIMRYIISGTHQYKAPHKRYGAMGQVGMVAGESYISVSARNWKTTPENVKEFQKIRLFVGNSGKNFKARLSIPDKGIVKENVNTRHSPVKIFTWHPEAPMKKFSLHLSGVGEIYGIAVDGKSGIAVDNIPFRGSSGTFFNTMDSTVMQVMLKELNVRLILLEFGGNKMPGVKSLKAIESYKKQMFEQIAFLKRICPGVKIILIGPADMSTKVNGKLRTYPYLEEMLDALKEAALANGAAFWNMYEVMGGENSMIEWVKHSPSLAAPDHVHFTSKGAERIADLFYESWMIYYDYYTFTAEKKGRE